MKTRILSVVALAALAFAAVACGGPHYQDTEVDSIVNPTGGTVNLDGNKITIPLGGAFKAHMVMYDNNHHRLGGGVTSDNGGVLAVSNEITGDDDWVFLGVTAGNTVVHLVAGGLVVRDIPAEVVDVQDLSTQP
jgi:hypothetical protein